MQAKERIPFVQAFKIRSMTTYVSLSEINPHNYLGQALADASRRPSNNRESHHKLMMNSHSSSPEHGSDDDSSSTSSDDLEMSNSINPKFKYWCENQHRPSKKFQYLLRKYNRDIS